MCTDLGCVPYQFQISVEHMDTNISGGCTTAILDHDKAHENQPYDSCVITSSMQA